MNLQSRGVLLAVALLSGWPSVSLGFNFKPTTAEWEAWSPLCKARYSISRAADGTNFAGAVPAYTVEEWKAQMGEYVWSHMHHYCAGLAFQFSARQEYDRNKKAEMLRRAASEADYTRRRLEPGMPLFTTTTIAMASISLDRGQVARAESLLKEAISAAPSEPNGYVALASVYQREGKMVLARDTLLTGDSATEGASAEIAYNLGLVSLELGDKEAARAYAERAYRMGYPLPGLRRKLAAVGVVL